jgi:hypothetical protein
VAVQKTWSGARYAAGFDGDIFVRSVSYFLTGWERCDLGRVVACLRVCLDGPVVGVESTNHHVGLMSGCKGQESEPAVDLPTTTGCGQCTQPTPLRSLAGSTQGYASVLRFMMCNVLHMLRDTLARSGHQREKPESKHIGMHPQNSYTWNLLPNTDQRERSSTTTHTNAVSDARALADRCTCRIMMYSYRCTCTTMMVEQSRAHFTSLHPKETRWRLTTAQAVSMTSTCGDASSGTGRGNLGLP